VEARAPMFTTLVWFLLLFLSILVAFSAHEYAHGRMAYWLGDPTPKYEGRLTLNPLLHLDLVGAVVLFFSLATTGGRVVVGWGKPVQFNSDALRDPIRDGALIAFAGPGANLVLAILAGLPVKLGLLQALPLAEDALTILTAVNIALFIFNLIPFPPLDGWKILQAFMPREFAWEMKRFETRVGMIPLLCLMGIIFFFGTYILGPPYAFLMEMLAGRMPLR
jgi:Zn-dependent protease